MLHPLATRVLRLNVACSNSPAIYWYRAGTSGNSADIAIALFHGLAPGGLSVYLFPALLLLRRRSARRAPVLIVEFPWLISDLSCMQSAPVDREDFIAGFCNALDVFQLRGVVVVAHSIGSEPLGWLLRSPEARHLVHGAALLEATALHQFSPECHNFACRTFHCFEALLSRHLMAMRWFDCNLVASMLPDHSLVVVSEWDGFQDVTGIARDVAMQDAARGLRFLSLPRQIHCGALCNPWCTRKVAVELDLLFHRLGGW
eukprot:NODE_6655_length_1651_cov_18.805118.p2 GENE.NODE_6655_length_1651_cov_18.805118~~NODE_6655_length_1651_cov_18.805118.p2  ORF type:complete len:259 (+),score=42.92 NODE_6655_length_1651_cov_18.805118:667-1443(+)